MAHFCVLEIILDSFQGHSTCSAGSASAVAGRWSCPVSRPCSKPARPCRCRP